MPGKIFILTKQKRVSGKFFNIDIDNQAFNKLVKILRPRRQTLISGTIKWMILGKPLFEMCWFYMGIAQIALGPPPLCRTGKRGKKVPQTILASPYTPGQTWGKKYPKPSWQAFTPHPPMRTMPIWKQHI